MEAIMRLRISEAIFSVICLYANFNKRLPFDPKRAIWKQARPPRSITAAAFRVVTLMGSLGGIQLCPLTPGTAPDAGY